MLWQDAITWLLSPPDQSLALLLADNGFDVWLTSTRGTKYSQGHTSLSTNDAVSFLPAVHHINSSVICCLNCSQTEHILFTVCRLIGIGHGMSW